MPRTWRQRRGQQTAGLVAEFLRPLVPGIEATPSAYAGNDMKHCPWDVEVKAPRDEGFTPRSAVRQARKRRKPEHILPPMVVLRPDGVGDENVADFIVLRQFGDDREILSELLELRREVHATARVCTECAPGYGHNNSSYTGPPGVHDGPWVNW